MGRWEVRQTSYLLNFSPSSTVELTRQMKPFPVGLFNPQGIVSYQKAHDVGGALADLV